MCRTRNDHEPGWDDLGIYDFKWNGESFSKQFIDYGPLFTWKLATTYDHILRKANEGYFWI